MEIHRERVLRSKWVFWRRGFFYISVDRFNGPLPLGAGLGGELGLRTSKVDISERMSRTSRAAWRFVFGSVMLDWGMAVAVCGSEREDPDIVSAVLSHDCVTLLLAYKLRPGLPACRLGTFRRRCKVVDYLMVCATVQLKLS